MNTEVYDAELFMGEVVYLCTLSSNLLAIVTQPHQIVLLD
jgi:hypothetical protein